ncbi:MAG: hypothetical protein KatS3mg060_2597 [Dehalococcoidia bacterium]|nr:MAG: hypothetical protein KatS3mg060_2597 [Dehalococcoidia bacterium]
MTRVARAFRWPTALIAAIVAVVLLAACTPPPSPTAGSVPPAATPSGAGTGHLIAFDVNAAKVHVFALPEMRLTGSLDNVGFDNHVGSLVLPDGRVLFTSKSSSEVLALAIDGAGKPSIVQRFKAELPEGGVWGQVDPTFRYFVVSSGYDDDRQALSVVDLKENRVAVLSLTMKEREEAHPWITSDPAQVYVGVGGEIQAYRLEDVLRGSAQPVATATVGLGSHGPVIAPDLKKILMTTSRGLEQVSYADGRLTAGTPIPWDANGRTTGRNARPRLSMDGKFVYGAIAATQPAGADLWAERAVDIHIANLIDGTAKRLPLDKGIAPRFQLSAPYAFFAVTSAAGDAAYLFDVDAASPSFQSIVGKIALPSLKNGPRPGEPAAGKEGRSLAITPDGAYAFVAQGGEAQILVIDTRRRSIVRTLDVPSPMTGGGYLVAVQPGMKVVDLSSR